MKCPFCGFADSRVLDSRPTDEDSRIRRRRECAQCSKRFTTYEIVESLPIVVVKKDDSREPFDRNKLLKGLLRACEKRPISLERLEQAVDEIEAQIQNSLEREVSTSKIGEYVMEQLMRIDDVAYIRFASVYRQFKDIKSFHEAIRKLMDDEERGEGQE
ncbi:MAG: transcriptional repressor NrdR [Clostridia bacterium]|nr:transcriptional repressor NrdR [Clostridia bacterium]